MEDEQNVQVIEDLQATQVTEDVQNAKLIFTVPSRSAKGYPKRMKRALEFKEKIDAGNFNVALIIQMIDFLIEFVKVEDKTLDEVKEIMWDLSQDDFENLLAGVAGGKKDEPPLAS